MKILIRLVSRRFLAAATLFLCACAESDALGQQTPKPEIRISAASQSSESVQLQVSASGGARLDDAHVLLNGKDVSASFVPHPCQELTCAEAMLLVGAELHPGKNVVQVIGQGPAGTNVTSRLRFEVAAPMAAAVAHNTGALSRLSTSATTPGFLPPTLGFVTTGVLNSNPTTIQVGNGASVSINGDCLGEYELQVLDRQALTQIKGYPQCFASASLLATALKQTNSTQLVIVNSIFTDGQNQSSNLDTSFIGGTQFTTPTSRYLAIGTGGAPAGQAYQSYRSNDSGFQPFAIGILQEDVNGNYNFQSSDTVEYVVSPNDTRYSGQSVIEVGVPVSQQVNGNARSLYTSPVGTNGYYLLVLDRVNLESSPGCGATGSSGNELIFANCGRFYPTGSSDPNQRFTAYKQLASDLNALADYQLAILTTVGQAGYGNNAFDVVGGSRNLSLGSDNGYQEFGPALDKLGGSPADTSGLFASGSAYTLISSPNFGDSLTGNAVLSSSVFAAQGQTGFVHGLLRRDLFGQFVPAHTSQESQAAYLAGNGADFTMGLLTTQQPVGWPELTATLPGAATMSGQIAAYHYLSYVLLTQAYIQGATGQHLDDIHYFFTGSNNTYLNYHTLDPLTMSFPTTATGPLPINSGAHVLCDPTTPNGSVCLWTNPVSNLQETFGPKDFSAVTYQLHTELVDFTNVLQFMVNGSVNMKDNVASGGSNTALALVGAAATVEGSNLSPDAASKAVKVNLANILNLVGSVVNIAATIGSDGIVPPNLTEKVNKGVTIIGDLFQASGSVAGGLASSTSTSNLPSAQYTFTSTIGQLANQNLQGQLSAGFDVTLDSILSDWGKLSVLGPKITDNTNSAFYSPNQVAQNLSITALNQGAQRSFYLALIPSFYSVHYWPELGGAAPYQPDMGWLEYGTRAYTCHAFYPSWRNSTYASASYPSYGGSANFYTQYNQGYDVITTWLIAGAVQNKGQSNITINFMDGNLANAIFSPAGLNLPFGPTVAVTGPFKNAFINLSNPDPVLGYKATSICSVLGSTPSLQSSPNPLNSTTTTLSAPATASFKVPIVLSASVASDAAAVSAGSVNFTSDGQTLGTVALDSSGHASLTVSDLSVGPHSLVAYYVRTGNYQVSQSSSAALMVYATPPDFSLQAASDSLDLSAGGTSSPLVVTLSSLGGFSGSVKLSCAGLPSGVSCAFTPSSISLGNGSLATSSLTVNRSATVGSRSSTFEKTIFYALLLPLCLVRRRAFCVPGAMRLTGIVLATAGLLGSMALLGCSGSTPAPTSTNSTGPATILVVAATATTAKSVPIVITFPK